MQKGSVLRGCQMLIGPPITDSTGKDPCPEASPTGILDLEAPFSQNINGHVSLH